MNYKYTAEWLSSHGIVLQESFTDRLCCYAKILKKKNRLSSINDAYNMLGCSKDNISRWKHNPCSTHASARRLKLSVVQKTASVFQLTEQEAENLANMAGLSLCKRQSSLETFLARSNQKIHVMLEKAGVSERMFQYYRAGKDPSKQSLLAIAISLELPLEEIQELLRMYGYVLSESLPNDAVVLWFLKNYQNTASQNISLIYSINDILQEMQLPLLMTKIYNCRTP